MKSIKQIREDYDLITEREENEEKKLASLARAGLFDVKKLPALKKALDKTPDKMTGQEKRMLVNLLDELMTQVLSNQGTYQKVKQNLMKEEKKQDFPVEQAIPSVLLLKRKAIRIFPDGQKVALYYAQSIDKYVSVPFSDAGISEETQIDEALPLVPLAIAGARVAAPYVARAAARYAPAIGRAALSAGKSVLSKGKNLAQRAYNAYKAKRTPTTSTTQSAGTSSGTSTAGSRAATSGRVGGSRTSNLRASARRMARERRRLASDIASNLASSVGGGGGSSSGSSGSTEPKYFTPMSSKAQATITGPKKEGGSDARAERERQASLKATKAMTNESVDLDGNIFEINNKASEKVKLLYSSLNKKNKKKMVEMMKESDESLEKVISFAVRQ